MCSPDTEGSLEEDTHKVIIEPSLKGWRGIHLLEKSVLHRCEMPPGQVFLGGVNCDQGIRALGYILVTGLNPSLSHPSSKATVSFFNQFRVNFTPAYRIWRVEIQIHSFSRYDGPLVNLESSAAKCGKIQESLKKCNPWSQNDIKEKPSLITFEEY